MNIPFDRINFKNEQWRHRYQVDGTTSKNVGKKEIRENNDLKGFRWRIHKNNATSGRIGLKPQSSKSTREFGGFKPTSTLEGPAAVFLVKAQPSEIIYVTPCFMECRYGSGMILNP